MKVVFDENISHHCVELMAKCGAPGEIQHTRKTGWNRTEDSVWMPIAVSAGFAIITSDRNERTSKMTAEGFRAMNAKVVLLGPFWDHLLIWDKTKWLVSRLDRIHASLEALPPGSCCIVDKSGKLSDA